MDRNDLTSMTIRLHAFLPHSRAIGPVAECGVGAGVFTWLPGLLQSAELRARGFWRDALFHPVTGNNVHPVERRAE
jgi:hypothetical protein